MVWLCKTKIWWKSKIVLYGYRYTYKPYVYINADDICKDIAEEIETRFDTSNYELDGSLTEEKNKKVIRLMKVELRGKIMTKFVGITAKTCSYLIDVGSQDKKEKCRKKCQKCMIKKKT